MIKKGNLVLAWNGSSEMFAKKYIYLTSIQGAVKPHICVSKNSELAYASGNNFHIAQFDNIRELDYVGAFPKKESIAMSEIDKIAESQGLLDSKQISEILNVSQSAVRNYFSDGRLEKVKVGFRTFVKPSELNEFIKGIKE